MRLSSASISLWLATIIMFCLVSCASNPPSFTPVEEQAELIGTVTISGEHPYERQLILADTAGVYWLIESPEYEGELLALGGQSIRALGIARTDASGYRNLRLRWYDLHPAPGRVRSAFVAVKRPADWARVLEEHYQDELDLPVGPRENPPAGALG